MTLLTAIAAAAEEHHGNVAMETMPYFFIAAAVFALLALVVFSYRNVANRHADKVERAAESTSHDAGHGH